MKPYVRAGHDQSQTIKVWLEPGPEAQLGQILRFIYVKIDSLHTCFSHRRSGRSTRYTEYRYLPYGRDRRWEKHVWRLSILT
jgi:hypothetical protein